MTPRRHRLPGRHGSLVHCLVLALLPSLGLAATVMRGPRHLPDGSPSSANPSNPKPANLPYLVAMGTPPLRFQPLPPPPDLITQPPAAAPPVPGGPLEEVAAVNRDSAIQLPPAPVTETPDLQTPPEEEKPIKAKPLRIIPDDAPREIRPEDVLRFFQFPGKPGTDTPPVSEPFTPPQPSTLPPSSATYRQT